MTRQVLCIWLPNWPCQRVAVDIIARSVIAAPRDRAKSREGEAKFREGEAPAEPQSVWRIESGSAGASPSRATASGESEAAASPSRVTWPTLPQPFALQIHDPRRGLRIAAADALAREAHIMPGMSLSEATALLPSLTILPYDPEADRRALLELTDTASEFSPLVGIESVDKQPWVGRHLAEPQAIFADVTNLTHFFGGPEKMAQVVNDWVLQKGYLPVTAIAPSLGSAWAAANYGHRREAITQAMTRLRQSTSPTFDDSSVSDSTTAVTLEGLEPIVWNEDNLQQQLDTLDVAALRIDSATYKMLQRLGIRSVGALRKLPRSSVAPRLGQALLQRLDSLYGNDQETFACHHAGPEFYVDITLEIPTDRRETIEELIRRLSVSLCQRLVRHGQGALQVLCRLSTVEKSVLTLKLGTYRPTAEAEHLQRLLLGQFEQQIRVTITLLAISLQATIVDSLRWQQTNLFEQAEVNLKNKTAELIDVLASRLGSEAVVRPEAVADPLPESARKFQELTGKDIGESKAKIAATPSAKLEAFDAGSIVPSSNDPLRRPLSLFASPVQLDVLAVYPDGPPVRFRWGGKLEQVVRHWGPERIETHWWSGPSQRRDYFRVETQTGAWLWLYRDLRDHGWFLHGEFV